MRFPDDLTGRRVDGVPHIRFGSVLMLTVLERSRGALLALFLVTMYNEL